jgi:cadmium resistance protein CadD (predicted permease)
LYLLGVKKLVTFKRKNKSGPKSEETAQDKEKSNNLAFAAVAAVSFSNGGDNIGVYTPLFAKYNAASQITDIAAYYYLVNHPLVASKIRRIGHIILPFVLFGLEIYILIESFVF